MNRLVATGLGLSVWLCAQSLMAGVSLDAGQLQQLADWFGQPINLQSLYSDPVVAGTAEEFHAAVDTKGPTLTLFAVNRNSGPVQIIGGYNPQDWGTPANGSTNGVDFVVTNDDADRTAFLFNLTTDIKFDQKLGDGDGKYQTRVGIDQLPGFGRFDLEVMFDFTSISTRIASYGPDPLSDPNILGETTGENSSVWDIRAFETFAVSPANQPIAPEPASVVVWSIVISLVAAVFIKRTHARQPQCR